jgi:hypothetical protein
MSGWSRFSRFAEQPRKLSSILTRAVPAAFTFTARYSRGLIT